jgi:hypothetical protein
MHKWRHIEFVAGLLIGALVTWVTAHIYSRLAKRDAAEQIKLLHSQAELMRQLLVALEAKGLVKLDRDPAGRVTGGHVIEVGTGSLSLTGYPPTITQGPAPGSRK